MKHSRKKDDNFKRIFTKCWKPNYFRFDYNYVKKFRRKVTTNSQCYFCSFMSSFQKTSKKGTYNRFCAFSSSTSSHQKLYRNLCSGRPKIFQGERIRIREGTSPCCHINLKSKAPWALRHYLLSTLQLHSINFFFHIPFIYPTTEGKKEKHLSLKKSVHYYLIKHD